MLQSSIAPGSNMEQNNEAAPESGTMQKNITSVTKNASQWQGSWAISGGTMELTQNGTAITGTITKGNTAFMLDGVVTNGVFKGSYLAPSATSLFGDIVTFEMDLSTDGKSINFKSFDSGANLSGLKGTKAMKK